MADGAGQIGACPPQQARRAAAGLSVLAVMAALVLAAALPILLQGGPGLASPSAGIIARAGWFTLKQAALSTVLSVGLAIPVALALLGLGGFAGKRVIVALFGVPMALPAIAAVAGILALFGRNGLAARAGFDLPDIYGLSGIVIAHVFFNMPLAARLLARALDGIADGQWKLCAGLRFPPLARFRFVILPVLRAALPGVAGLIFLLCAGSYTIVLVMGGGPGATTLQVAIYQALAFEFDPAKAAALTMAQLALTAAVFLALPADDTPQGGAAFATGQRWQRQGGAQAGISWMILLAAAAVVAAPLAAIVLAGLSADHARLMASAGVRRAALTSLAIASASGALALSGGVLLAVGEQGLKRMGKGAGAALLVRSATGILGVPPLLMGVGWFILLAQLGQPFGFAPVMIVLANALMALPFVLQLARPVLATHFSATDRLCATLGLSGFNRLRLIDWTALRRPLAPALALAMALSLGDLGVVTLYGADTITTLPSLVYRSLGSYRTHDSDGLVLYLAVITGLLAALGMGRVNHGR